ncbi:MAG: hypothetical protein ACFFBP_00015 [Promethearchaeota archaeon]
MEIILTLSMFCIVLLLLLIIIYLLKSNMVIKKDIDIIKDELDITSAISDVKFNKYRINYKKRGSKLRNTRDREGKKQLSLDFFINS